MQKPSLLIAGILCLCFNSNAQSVFINEVNYLAAGANRGIEIAGPAGENLSGWSLEMYNADGTLNSSKPVDGEIPNQQAQHGTIWMEVAQLNSSRSAALVDDNGEVAHYVSYGSGGTPATQGAAAGLAPQFIGLQLLPLNSLQLVGIGALLNDFSWLLAVGTSPGQVNNMQIFSLLSGLGGLLSREGPPMQSLDVKVFPNPTGNQLSIQLLTDAAFKTETNISIFDMTGRLMAERSISPGQTSTQFDVSNWPAAAYTLVMFAEGRELKAIRFAKR